MPMAEKLSTAAEDRAADSLSAHKVELASLCTACDLSYPKECRLRKRGNFHRTEEQGKKRQGSYIAITFVKKQKGETRLGITVTKRYGKAHDRNRFKRVVREAFRLIRFKLPSPIDLVVKPRQQAPSASSKDIEGELLALLSS